MGKNLKFLILLLKSATFLLAFFPLFGECIPLERKVFKFYVPQTKSSGEDLKFPKIISSGTITKMQYSELKMKGFTLGIDLGLTMNKEDQENDNKVKMEKEVITIWFKDEIKAKKFYDLLSQDTPLILLNNFLNNSEIEDSNTIEKCWNFFIEFNCSESKTINKDKAIHNIPFEQLFIFNFKKELIDIN